MPLQACIHGSIGSADGAACERVVKRETGEITKSGAVPATVIGELTRTSHWGIGPGKDKSRSVDP